MNNAQDPINKWYTSAWETGFEVESPSNNYSRLTEELLKSPPTEGTICHLIHDLGAQIEAAMGDITDLEKEKSWDLPSILFTAAQLIIDLGNWEYTRPDVPATCKLESAQGITRIIKKAHTIVLDKFLPKLFCSSPKTFFACPLLNPTIAWLALKENQNRANPGQKKHIIKLFQLIFEWKFGAKDNVDFEYFAHAVAHGTRHEPNLTKILLDMELFQAVPILAEIAFSDSAERNPYGLQPEKEPMIKIIECNGLSETLTQFPSNQWSLVALTCRAALFQLYPVWIKNRVNQTKSAS